MYPSEIFEASTDTSPLFQTVLPDAEGERNSVRVVLFSPEELPEEEPPPHDDKTKAASNMTTDTVKTRALVFILDAASLMIWVINPELDGKQQMQLVTGLVGNENIY